MEQWRTKSRTLVFLLSVYGVYCSKECGTRKATYFMNFFGSIYVHYTYESLICTHGCCGSVDNRHCCSPTENHTSAIVGGAIGGTFALFCMVALTLFLCRYYKLKKIRTFPDSIEEQGVASRTVSYHTRMYNHERMKHIVRMMQNQCNEPPPEYRPPTADPARTESPPPYRVEIMPP